MLDGKSDRHADLTSCRSDEAAGRDDTVSVFEP